MWSATSPSASFSPSTHSSTLNERPFVTLRPASALDGAAPSDADGVGRARLLAAARLLPVLLLRRLDLVAVVAGSQPSSPTSWPSERDDVVATALGADAIGWSRTARFRLGERKGRHVGAQRDRLHYSASRSASSPYLSATCSISSRHDVGIASSSSRELDRA